MWPFEPSQKDKQDNPPPFTLRCNYIDVEKNKGCNLEKEELYAWDIRYINQINLINIKTKDLLNKPLSKFGYLPNDIVIVQYIDDSKYYSILIK